MFLLCELSVTWYCNICHWYGISYHNKGAYCLVFSSVFVTLTGVPDGNVTVAASVPDLRDPIEVSLSKLLKP